MKKKFESYFNKDLRIPSDTKGIIRAHSNLLNKEKDCGVKIMKESDHYIKIVEWSDEDGCFVGSCPGIIDTCCHGDDEIQVYTELCQIVNEWIETIKNDGKPLQSPTMSRILASKLLNVA